MGVFFGLLVIIIGIVVLSMLGTLQRERLIKRVGDELEDEDWKVRVKAVMELNEFLEKFTDDQIVRLLLKALRDKVWRVRIDAADEASQEYNPHTTMHNPDFSECTLPVLRLKQVVIHIAPYDFFQVECFLTYAVNYIGQKCLKKYVDVYLYGDPEKLHPNLRNNLTNLCRRIHRHEGYDIRFA